MLRIRVDSREQLPFTFDPAVVKPREHYEVLRGHHLRTGDYLATIEGPEDCPDVDPWTFAPADAAVVERKSLSDLYATLGSRRNTFRAEFERMASYGYAALVIESPWEAILQPNLHLSHATQMNPRSVAATLISWSQRYNVHLHPMPNRDFAEKFTFRILEWWYRQATTIAPPLLRCKACQTLLTCAACAAQQDNPKPADDDVADPAEALAP